MRVQITSKSAAYSAIMDVDLARTSTDLAVTNIYAPRVQLCSTLVY